MEMSGPRVGLLAIESTRDPRLAVSSNREKPRRGVRSSRKQKKVLGGKRGKRVRKEKRRKEEVMQGHTMPRKMRERLKPDRWAHIDQDSKGSLVQSVRNGGKSGRPSSTSNRDGRHSPRKKEAAMR